MELRDSVPGGDELFVNLPLPLCRLGALHDGIFTPADPHAHCNADWSRSCLACVARKLAVLYLVLMLDDVILSGRDLRELPLSVRLLTLPRARRPFLTCSEPCHHFNLHSSLVLARTRIAYRFSRKTRSSNGTSSLQCYSSPVS